MEGYQKVLPQFTNAKATVYAKNCSSHYVQCIEYMVRPGKCVNSTKEAIDLCRTAVMEVLHSLQYPLRLTITMYAPYMEGGVIKTIPMSSPPLVILSKNSIRDVAEENFADLSEDFCSFEKSGACVWVSSQFFYTIALHVKKLCTHPCVMCGYAGVGC